jgi:hypothetical protein
MARYFFHIRDGDRIIQDVEGAELPDFAAAELEATRFARSIVAVAICGGGELTGQGLIVEDEQGRQGCSVRFVGVLPARLKRALKNGAD